MSSDQHARYPVLRSAGKQYVDVPRNAYGYIVWGPYQTLAPGDYEVAFEIQPLEFESESEACCKIDIAADFGNEILLQRDFSVGELLKANGKAEAIFSLKKPSVVEYRVFGINGAGFRVRYYRKARPIGSGGQPVRLWESEVYAQNYDQICLLERCGVEFRAGRDGLVAKADDIVLDVENAEDLQVIAEVFLAKEYNVLPPGRCIAIDIGMNVGVASLALAKNPQVEVVFAYEPFAAPFRRAALNFERNPQLSAKIQPFNVGLADRDEDLDVFSDPTSTIGVSIRGAASGRRERIQIKDAGEELRPHIENAAKRGLGVVVKVDCEGSEFAIFDSLTRESLLSKIDAFMIEWHKWWSSDKTQADLIAPLREAGFFVFDRTHPANPHAGLLLAIRSARGPAAGRDAFRRLRLAAWRRGLGSFAGWLIRSRR